MAPPLRHRQNIRVLGEEYLTGNKKPLSDIIRAWQGIQNKDVTDPNSFFMIAGYHGEPFRGAGWGNAQWWGGYCNHGNVLFPTWHRAYLYRLENALRSVKGCEHVALPYWDETEPQSQTGGIPWVFLQRTIELDTGGPPVQNPLYSYTFQLQVWDNVGSPQTNGDYYKSKGYVTKRFPFCGFDGQVSGDPETQSDVDSYNTWISSHGDEAINGALSANVTDWIKPSTAIESIGIAAKYAKCLHAPNYTVFSNTTSATQYNEETLNVQGSTLNDQGRQGSPEAYVPLESPHNDMHLAVGGFNLNNFSANIVQNFFGGDHKTLTLANGDMGENNTASFDPIFFFHHCFVDKVFWDWQKLHKSTKTLEIIEGYPGTNSVDNQGPTPGVAGGTWLTLDSPLAPFKQGDALKGPAMTSNHVIDIEGQLGYTYDEPLRGALPHAPQVAPVQHHAQISGLNRAAIGGSFVIQVHKKHTDGTKQLLGFESVLSRWQTSGCANCQNHLNVKTYIPLPGITDDDIANRSIVASITPRQNLGGKLMVGGGDVPQIVPRILQTAPAATTQVRSH